MIAGRGDRRLYRSSYPHEARRNRTELPGAFHHSPQDAVDPGRVTLAELHEPVVDLPVDAAATSTLGVRWNCANCLSVRGGMSEQSISESSPAACRLAIPDRTAFCFLFIGLLNIDSALTLTRFAGRDNAVGLFFAIFILRSIHVDDQATSAPSRNPWCQDSSHGFEAGAK